MYANLSNSCVKDSKAVPGIRAHFGRPSVPVFQCQKYTWDFANFLLYLVELLHYTRVFSSASLDPSLRYFYAVHYVNCMSLYAVPAPQISATGCAFRVPDHKTTSGLQCWLFLAIVHHWHLSPAVHSHPTQVIRLLEGSDAECIAGRSLADIRDHPRRLAITVGQLFYTAKEIFPDLCKHFTNCSHL